jgi:diadenosine tetraphosphate (Ap4A) HIT family hydrolase
VGRHSTDTEVGADWRSDRVGSARRGENPMVLGRMRSGWAVIGDTQFLPGYCVLLSDDALFTAESADMTDMTGTDGADHLTDLPRAARADFLIDVGLLGEAMMAACNGLDPSLRRLNYEILGNTDHYLHAHIYPRYGWEPDELLRDPVSRGYPSDRWTSPRDAYAEEHEPLRDAIAAELARVMAEAYGPLG